LRFRGHQFRYSELRLQADIECGYAVRRRRGGEVFREGYRIGNTLASYVHAHWASNPLMAEGFVQACSAQTAKVTLKVPVRLGGSSRKDVHGFI
jgi:cobyrinic acid a,c-diamide synthase